MTRSLRAALAAAFFVLAWSLPASGPAWANAIQFKLTMVCLPPDAANGVLADRGLRPAQQFTDTWGDAWVLWLGQDQEGRQTWTLTTDAVDDGTGITWRCLAAEGPPAASGEGI